MHKSEAFTLIELMLVIVIVFVLAVLFVWWAVIYPQLPLPKIPRIACMNNLKQIGTAYRVWANEYNDHFPASQSVANGGWREVLTNADQGLLCWTNYAIMANELGQTAKILVCPSDERKPADTFTNFANANLSYFVGVSANDSEPQSLLGGDRNLGAGTEPGRDYGFSPENGQGNDVAIPIKTRDGPVCWSLKMHSVGRSEGAGNILLGDGSVQQVGTLLLRTNWQPHFNPTTNWPAGYAPSSPSIRVLFP